MFALMNRWTRHRATRHLAAHVAIFAYCLILAVSAPHRVHHFGQRFEVSQADTAGAAGVPVEFSRPTPEAGDDADRGNGREPNPPGRGASELCVQAWAAAESLACLVNGVTAVQVSPRPATVFFGEEPLPRFRRFETGRPRGPPDPA